jgi:hypothetical protein
MCSVSFHLCLIVAVQQSARLFIVFWPSLPATSFPASAGIAMDMLAIPSSRSRHDHLFLSAAIPARTSSMAASRADET